MKLYCHKTLSIAAGICAVTGIAHAQDIYYNGPSGNATIFENQINVSASIIDTYFGMVGHNWGYGGIQMQGTTSTKAGIFSIWDQGTEESTMYAYNAGLSIQKMGRFGGEGTGAQFLFNYNWNFGTNYRCAYRVFQESDGVHLRLNAFFYDASLGTWTYVVTYRANTGGQTLPVGSLYSFNENYGGTYGNRTATMNNAWAWVPGSGWSDLSSGSVFNIPMGPNDFGQVLTNLGGFTYNSGPNVTVTQANWSPVSYTPSGSDAPIVIPYYLSCGNANAEGNWEPDNYFTSAGTTYTYNNTTSVNTSSISNPAPQLVYQNLRGGNDFQYNLVGFIPGRSYTVKLHFVENYDNGVGQRLENVAINGSQVLTNFDIFKTAGRMFKAVSKSFSATADSTGNIVVHFTTASGSQDWAAVVSAVEVH